MQNENDFSAINELVHRIMGLEQPLFYCSPIRLEGKPLRGGVPILFPQFADRGPLQKHGFARNLPWHQRDSKDSETFAWQLDIETGQVAGWDHSASLSWTCTVEKERLSMLLRIQNTGAEAFSWSGGLHPYWCISDLSNVQLHGFSEVAYQDKGHEKQQVFNRSEMCFDGSEVERCFLSMPETVTLVDHGWKRQIRMSVVGEQESGAVAKAGFPNCMVWNPGAELAKGIHDLPNGGWRCFLCIEPVVVNPTLLLEPGEVWMGSLEVGVFGG